MHGRNCRHQVLLLKMPRRLLLLLLQSLPASFLAVVLLPGSGTLLLLLLPLPLRAEGPMPKGPTAAHARITLLYRRSPMLLLLLLGMQPAAICTTCLR
jgi:hypothetical protein